MTDDTAKAAGEPQDPFLLHLIDVVHSVIHEDESVPSTSWARDMLNQARESYDAQAQADAAKRAVRPHKGREAARERVTTDYVQSALASTHNSELSPCVAVDILRAPIADALGRAFERGFNAATYDQPALKVLSSLRWRAHREKRNELALLIGQLEYRIQNWDTSAPTREMPLPDNPKEPTP